MLHPIPASDPFPIDPFGDPDQMIAISRNEFRVMVSTTAAMMTLRFSVSIYSSA
jgi:hypothetical protein